MSELKPCPFCGGEAKFEKLPAYGYKVYCVGWNCPVELKSRFSHTEDGAAEYWNSRASSWVKVSDRLPEFEREVLVCYRPSVPTMENKLRYALTKRLDVTNLRYEGFKEKIERNHGFFLSGCAEVLAWWEIEAFEGK